MTRKELCAKLKDGGRLEELFHFASGQNGIIFKADTFSAGEDIVYIPDIVKNNIPVDRPLENLVEIFAILFTCYTGSDFVTACGGRKDIAKNLFLYCDGQHPVEGLRESKNQLPEQIPITIFQAPLAALVEKGVYREMHNLEKPFDGVIPTEYYLTVFKGGVDCPECLPKDPDQRRSAILEHVLAAFNAAHPVGYAGRSLSVGDIVQLEGKNYLYAALGFVPVAFERDKKKLGTVPAPTVCELALPDGTKLRASACNDTDYPSINIDLLTDDGKHEQICFVEHNPEKSLGHRLCIGVYRAEEDEPCYYDSYNREC